MNSIAQTYSEADSNESNTELAISTIFLSFSAILYTLYVFKQQIESLTTKKKDIDVDDMVQEDMYQAWSGSFADGEDSLLITIVRQKENLKRKNDEWIGWDQSNDASVTARDFYLGNQDPSFSWTLQKRDDDTHAFVKETMMDGWNSVIYMKLDAFLKEKENVNEFLKRLLCEEEIEWQKILMTKEEFTVLFAGA